MITLISTWAVCLLLLKSAVGLKTSIVCVECSTATQPDLCPADNFVFFPDQVNNVPCVYGACYSTLEKFNGTDISVRGCTNDLKGMPYSLPQDGAYTWQGKSINVCFDDLCNILPPEKSSGKRLDDHLKKPVNTAARGPIECFQCMNYDTEGNKYTQCPKNDVVDEEKAYAGTCNNTCFTRTFGDDHNRVARGCSDSQWGLPYPLPPDGCYNWENGVWCVCNRPGCNGRPLGRSTGKELDDHLYEDTGTDFEEEDGKNRCFECINYGADGTYYKQCPKHKRVRNAYLSECNGTCFTRSYDYDDRKVARGCSETQYGLPNPLPPDGCYKYYSEVWCVCSKSRCNRNPIGPPKDIEFDAHIKVVEGGVVDGGNGKGMAHRSQSWLLFTSCLFGTLFVWTILH